MKPKAVGHRGSWFATVGKEEYPCVHEHWFHKGRYDDPGARPGIPKFEELHDAIVSKKTVVLTRDRVMGEYQFERIGYIALFAVDSISFDDAGLRFVFTKRLAELE